MSARGSIPLDASHAAGSAVQSRAQPRGGRNAGSVHFFYLILSLGVGLAGWHVFCTYFFPSILFPGPVQVAREAYAEILSGTLFADVKASLVRIVVGFSIGSLLGMAVGLLIGFFPVVKAVLNPYLQFFRFIPPIAWVSPAMIWFGIGEQSKIFIIIYGTLFTVALNTALGVASVHPNKIRAAQMFGATQWQVFRLVVIPSTVTPILQGMRLAMGVAFMTVVAAEMLAAEAGIGYSILNARMWMATDKIFVGIFTLGCLGYITDKLLELAIRRFAGHYNPTPQRH